MSGIAAPGNARFNARPLYRQGRRETTGRPAAAFSRRQRTQEIAMQGKIAFEEHFAIEETLEETRSFAGDSGQWDDFTRQLLDLGAERLGNMDDTGIELAIRSLNAPGVQRILDAREALAVARKANDRMAEAVATNSSRYAAFAALPMHDAEIAARELTRCVSELGFKGCMVNGFQQTGDPDNVKYYDL